MREYREIAPENDPWLHRIYWNFISFVEINWINFIHHNLFITLLLGSKAISVLAIKTVL